MSASTFVFAITAAIVCAAGIGWAGIAKIDGMVANARTTAIAERDAHWQAEIARSNQEVAELRADQAEHVAAIDADAHVKIALAEREATEVRKDSDALPDDGSCGLSLDRVQLLDR